MFIYTVYNKQFCETERANFPERFRQRVNLEEAHFSHCVSEVQLT
jgi:hypothetical protein